MKSRDKVEKVDDNEIEYQIIQQSGIIMESMKLNKVEIRLEKEFIRIK
jgi:hypothetical protein